MAKEPRPGFVKTRLCPPCTPEEAATLAEACLADTLATVTATPATHRLVALDGRPGRWLPDGLDVVPQVGGDLGHRLDAAVAAAFARCPEGPVVVIGMDTPQVRPGDLAAAAAALDPAHGHDAALGPTADGGYWVIGLRRPLAGAFDGVPMSTSHTGAAQRRRLDELGCRVWLAPELVDVDDIASARVVAASAPQTRFARALTELEEATAP